MIGVDMPFLILSITVVSTKGFGDVWKQSHRFVKALGKRLSFNHLNNVLAAYSKESFTSSILSALAKNCMKITKLAFLGQNGGGGGGGGWQVKFSVSEGGAPPPSPPPARGNPEKQTQNRSLWYPKKNFKPFTV